MPRPTLDPAAIIKFLDERSTYSSGGYPNRRRKYINGCPVNDTDARMIRRWRKGDIRKVTEPSVRALLQRHLIDPQEFIK